MRSCHIMRKQMFAKRFAVLLLDKKKKSHFRGFIRQGINFYKDVTFFLNNTINNRVRSVE